MEFGAAVCRARTPRCAACPIRRGCPSRRVAVRVAVPRQPAFHGSDRAYRGTLLRLLADVAPPHRLPEAELRAALAGASRRAGPPLGDADWDRLLGRLAAEGLVHRSGEEVGLGGKVAAATIGP
jgi:A/G-specific adenine glycosylase